jgi:hypothetical protein
MITNELIFKAEQGDVNSQWDLCWEYYESGDDEKQLYWARKAAENGHPRALWRLGDLYEWGDCGLQRDLQKAIEYYQLAANAGDASGYYSLADSYYMGHVSGKGWSDALELFKKSESIKSKAQTQERIARCYYYGDTRNNNVGSDIQQAIEWYEKAIAQDEPTAQFHYATLLIKGGREIERAVDLVRKSIASGELTDSDMNSASELLKVF